MGRVYNVVTVVQPPIQLSTLSGKYATAAFSVALGRSPQTLAQVETELKNVGEAVRKDKAAQAMLANPTLSARERRQGAEAVLKTAKVESDVVRNLFDILADNGRLSETEAVLADFNELVSAHRGEIKITIIGGFSLLERTLVTTHTCLCVRVGTAAQPLDSVTQSRLEKALRSSGAAQNAKSVRFEHRSRPELLGGLIVDFGDKTIDLSVQSRVQRLNSLLQRQSLPYGCLCVLVAKTMYTLCRVRLEWERTVLRRVYSQRKRPGLPMSSRPIPSSLCDGSHPLFSCRIAGAFARQVFMLSPRRVSVWRRMSSNSVRTDTVVVSSDES
jgi:F-type H+-transporting ATPase subunit O